MKKAIFFDRDGTIIYDVGYLNDEKNIKFIPGIFEAFKKFQKRGFLLIMVSNQSGVKRGLITHLQFQKIHEKIISYFEKEDIFIDDSFYCFHHPHENCKCRKPSPKMIFQAKEKYDIDLENSYMIGDKITDIISGKNSGCKTILFNTRNLTIKEDKPDFSSNNWNEICEYILNVENKIFDVSKINLKKLSERIHDYDLSNIKPLKKLDSKNIGIKNIASKIKESRENGKEIIFMMGAHVIKNGLQRYIIDLLKNGYITCIATNGACVIHDYEFSLIGKTSENVGKYISEGQFGLWEETGKINDIINKSFKEDPIGIGRCIGKEILESKYENREISIFGNCYNLNIPITVHVGIGYDIIHEHPNFDGCATGQMSYIDFLKFAYVLNNFENGVLLSFGSATMGPEVFLKALAMCRNVAKKESREIKHFTTAVFDLFDLPENLNILPEKDSHLNFFRPWKTILSRTISDGGNGFYIKGRHEDTIPELWTLLNI